jgi:hypothetical protein
MRLKTASILALGIALAIPLSANAAPSERARRHVPVHHRTAVMRAEAPRAAILAPARPAFGDNETDGLSRNPADCATYGCIDSGGG